MAFEAGKPITMLYDETFSTRDQLVSDLATPRPETRHCLIELPKEELEALEAGAKFRILEHSSGGAALCTKTKTYALEFLENSNTQLLGFAKSVKQDTLELAGEVVERLECKLFAQVRGQMFVKPAVGDTTRVRSIISEHELGPPRAATQASQEADGAQRKSRPPTETSLEYQVAASTSEIRKALAEGPYVEMDGGWKIIPPAFERELLDVALSAVTANGWDKQAVSPHALLEAVQNHFGEGGEQVMPSVQVLLKVLQSVLLTTAEASGTVPETQSTGQTQKEGATQKDSSGPDTGGNVSCGGTSTSIDVTGTQSAADVIKLDVEKVHLFEALQLIHTAPTQVRRRFGLPPPGPRQKRARVGGANAGAGREGDLLLSELATAFREVTGEEKSETDLIKMLGIRAYFDEIDGTVHALDVETLPLDPRARLKALFQMMSYWRPDMITKIVSPVICGAKPDAWMMKHTRQAFIEFEPGKEERFITRKFVGM
eukprot:TRINITY_DN44226_c0_g1_i1.p1 TRINITY_DN44226_c0_g1~~TRINITY_DN44226_c0_g1_i1.p1  ORF type:complete len:514 (+),score=93.64 TRINITY_DN44226_c0_g1_i1:80-1543(+)